MVDSSVEIRSKATRISKEDYTYREFAIFVLDCIAAQARAMNATQIDIVQDCYHELSVKSGTRHRRGMSTRTVFTANDKVPNDFIDLLMNSDFKKYLNALFLENLTLDSWSWEHDYSISDDKYVTEFIEGVQQRRNTQMGSGRNLNSSPDFFMQREV